MEAGHDKESPPSGPGQSHFKDEVASICVSVDLDTQSGLPSPPAKGAKLSESPDLPPPEPTWEVPDDIDDDDDDDDDEAQSPDSLILDLFHAESSDESHRGIYVRHAK
jgi:hypothetical protein